MQSEVYPCDCSDASVSSALLLASRLAKVGRVASKTRQMVSEEACKVQSSSLVTHRWRLNSMPEIIACFYTAPEGHDQLQLKGVSQYLLEIILIVTVCSAGLACRRRIFNTTVRNVEKVRDMKH